MKDIEERRFGYSYSDLIDSFEVKVLLTVEDRSYQGDTRYLLRDGNGRYGILVFGWGSCSGRDALEACWDLAEVRKLRDSLWEQVTWRDSAAEMLEYVDTKDWKLDYSYSPEFIQGVRGLLATAR